MIRILVVIIAFCFTFTRPFNVWGQENRVVPIYKDLDFNKQRPKTNNFTLVKQDITITDSIQLIDKSLILPPINQPIKKPKTVLSKPWRFSFSGGYGMRIAPTNDLPDDIAAYKKGLRYGSFLGTDLTHFINPNIGLGVKYSLFLTQNSADFATSEVVTVPRSDIIQIHYAGPFISLRSVVKREKVFSNFDFSIGYSAYQNNISGGLEKYKLRGGNFGFVSSLGVDFMLTRDMSFGLSLNISAASISKLKYNQEVLALTEEQTENISRVGLGLIIRYYR